MKSQPDANSIRRLTKYLLFVGLLMGCGAAFYFLRVRPHQGAPPFQPEVIDVRSNQQTTNQLIDEVAGGEFDPNEVSVLIEKSAYRLTVRYELEPVKVYPVVFGSEPVGDKLAEGDRKTPEGIYRVRDLYPHPQWSKFIWLDYPTPQDWQEHDAAKLAGEIPATATIGSEIGIHGVPDGSDGLIDSRTNWTWGCVSLKNEDVDEIYSVLSQGTVIEIVP